MFQSASVLFPRRFFLAIEAQTAFISYSREDSEFALRLAGGFEGGGSSRVAQISWILNRGVALGACRAGCAQ